MSPLNELWAGKIFGTNTGNIFLEISEKEGLIEGLLKISDDRFGLSSYSVAGKAGEGYVEFEATPTEEIAGFAQGKVAASGRLLSNGHIRGEWKSEIGTAGAFELFPHLGSKTDSPTTSGPEQLYTAVRELGALRLYGDDVANLMSVLRRKFPSSRIVVTHLERGAELALYADEFEKRVSGLGRLTWIKLSVSEPAGGGLSKSVTIDLGQAFNRVTTQGPDESWVLGEAEATASYLKQKEKRLSTAIGKYRVNINQLIALGALIAMPDLALMQRAAFISSVVALLWIASKAQNILIPNFSVDFTKKTITWPSQIWPSLLSWTISATAAIAASFIYGVLEGRFGG